MKKEKYTEFWIAPKLYSPIDPVEAEYFIAYDQPVDPKRLEIHVIEYSAYENLKQIIKDYEEALEQVSRGHTVSIFFENDGNFTGKDAVNIIKEKVLVTRETEKAREVLKKHRGMSERINPRTTNKCYDRRSTKSKN